MKTALSFLLTLMLFAGLVAVAYLRPAPRLPDTAIPLAGPIDRIVVEKAARRMTLYQGGQPVRVYPIALGFAPVGDKLREGDGKTPRSAPCFPASSST
jgi:murein L,D-transpeptidase YafK